MDSPGELDLPKLPEFTPPSQLRQPQPPLGVVGIVGVAAGVAAGICLLVAAGLLLAWCCFRRRRQTFCAPQAAIDPAPVQASPPPHVELWLEQHGGGGDGGGSSSASAVVMVGSNEELEDGRESVASCSFTGGGGGGTANSGAGVGEGGRDSYQSCSHPICMERLAANQSTIQYCSILL
ncbi:hypothetical protein ACP4OV_002938 [Aristida adscensionis]